MSFYVLLLSVCCIVFANIYIFSLVRYHTLTNHYFDGKKNNFGLVEALKRNVWPEEALSNIELNVIS